MDKLLYLLSQFPLDFL